MLRESLLFLSQSATAKQVVTRAPVSRQLARRFVAGDTLDEAIQAAAVLNRNGLAVSLDYLGEAVRDREGATAAAAVAVASLERLASDEIDGNISVKPSQLGLDIEEEFCRDNIRRILERARELGPGDDEIFVRLDMESDEYTERTIALVEHFWEQGFRNVGTVLQSALRRTPDDVERLIRLGSRVRLVKGAYNPPDEIAFPEKADVDRKFIEEMKRLLEDGHYPAIATHDEAMISATRHWAFEIGLARDAFEFQLLYGVRRDLQTRLREDGYNVRVYIPFGDSWYSYLMRRLAERPANVFFLTGSVLREAPLPGLRQSLAAGAGLLAGIAGTAVWRRRRNGR